jgi:hypothetical protein
VEIEAIWFAGELSSIRAMQSVSLARWPAKAATYTKRTSWLFGYRCSEVTTMIKSIRVLAILIAATSLSAQTSYKAQPAPSPYLNRSFEPSTSTISPSFRGHDAEALWAAVAARKRGLQKSEFETQAEYDGRAAAFSRVPVLGGLTPGSTFAFIVPLEATYDAENGLMKIANPLSEDYSYLQSSAHSVTLREQRTPVGTYIGTNAFGVKKKILKVLIRKTELLLEIPNWMKKDVFPSPYTYVDSLADTVELAMNAPDARRHKPGLRALLIGNLASPFTASADEHSTPTIDDPYDRTYVKHAVVLAIQELWIVDVRSGEVLAQYSEEAHRAQFPLQVVITATEQFVTPHPEIMVDGKKQPFQLIKMDGVQIDAQHEVRLSLAMLKVGSKSIPYTIVVNGKDRSSDWSCTPKYRDYQDCTLLIAAGQD